MVWLVLVLLVILVALCILISVCLLLLVTQKKDLGPQGFQGIQGQAGNQGETGVQGVVGSIGERWFQGSSAIQPVAFASVLDLTFDLGPEMTFGDGSRTKNFPGSRLIVDKLMTLQFANVFVKTITNNLTGFAMDVTLPDGYQMLDIETPTASWIGYANNMQQNNSTPSPIYLFDTIKISTTRLQLRFVCVNGFVSVDQVVFLWCSASLTIQIQ